MWTEPFDDQNLSACLNVDEIQLTRLHDKIRHDGYPTSIATTSAGDGRPCNWRPMRMAAAL
jgi:hypothetical protein